MTQSKGEIWIDLLKRREELEGLKIVEMMVNLATCQYILNTNYMVLNKNINSYETNPDLWNVDNRKQLADCQKEILRHLHNYLASIYFLIDNTRHFCKDLRNSELDTDYKNKIEILLTNDCIKFMQDLRNYITHYKLPLFSATLEWHQSGKNGEGASEQKLILHQEDLLKWDRWSSGSKKYMEKNGKEINLKLSIIEYQKLIIVFYDWFYERVIKLNIKEIRELLKIESEMLNLQS